MPTGGEILVDCLAAHGVRRIFTVAGESFLAALDALHDDRRIRPIACRNEAGAAMMAEATGKLTGAAGVALVTRGPGCANAVSGVYIARHDATPMLLLVGLPRREFADRDAFQAVDIARLFGGLAKSTATASSAVELPELIAKAMRLASADLPGPVVIGLPEDVLDETADIGAGVVSSAPLAEPSAQSLAAIRDALAFAQRPLVIAGGSVWSTTASADLARFAERFDLPVAASFRRQDRLDNRHRCYAGHAGLGMDSSLLAGMKIADVVIAIGARLGEVTSAGYSLFTREAADRGQTLIRIAANAEQGDPNYPHATLVAAHPIAAVAALADLKPPGKTPAWGHWRRDLRAAYEATLRHARTPRRVRLDAVVEALSEMLPERAIVTNGAGNYAAFLNRYFSYRAFPSQLAPTSGSMGYGLPAAIAAKLEFPELPVVAFAGDGCFQMTGQELATAAQFGAGVVVIIANNGSLGTIRMQQERRYPGRVTATSLLNPDFVALAQSYGCSAARVSEPDEVRDALRRALDAAASTRRPAVVELSLDLDDIAPEATLTEIAERAPPPAPTNS